MRWKGLHLTGTVGERVVGWEDAISWLPAEYTAATAVADAAL